MLNRNKSFDFTSKSLKSYIFWWFHQKNLLRSVSYRVQKKKKKMTWHSLSSSLAWHKEQILTCLRVLGTVYLPVSMRSRWFPRLNLLIADIWRGFFIASRNSVLLVSVLKLKYCKNLVSCSRQDWRVGGWLKLWTDFERHWRWGFYRCFHLKSWSVSYIHHILF